MKISRIGITVYQYIAQSFFRLYMQLEFLICSRKAVSVTTEMQLW